jgi:hypothetical protein
VDTWRGCGEVGERRRDALPLQFHVLLLLLQ